MTWALAAIAALLIGYAAVSRRLETANVSGAMFFTTAGLLVGPVLGLLDLHVHSEQVKLLAEITLTLVLFADASRISLRALRHEFAVPLRLLGIGLPLTIVAGALVGAAVLPGISFAEALVLAIVLALHRRRARPGGRLRRARPVPDPPRAQRRERAQRRALRAAVLHRDRVRRDGRGHDVRALRRAARARADRLRARRRRRRRRARRRSRCSFAARRRLIEPHWLQILSVASALLAAGVATALGGSIFIAAFTGGFLFGALRRDTGGEVTYLVDEGGELFNARDVHRLRRGHPRPAARRASPGRSCSTRCSA